MWGYGGDIWQMRTQQVWPEKYIWNLTASSLNSTSISLQWNNQNIGKDVTGTSLFMNNVMIMQEGIHEQQYSEPYGSFSIKSLEPETNYLFFLVHTLSLGKISVGSNYLLVTTPAD